MKNREICEKHIVIEKMKTPSGQVAGQDAVISFGGVLGYKTDLFHI